MADNYGKKFEKAFSDQLKENGYCFDRLKDDMSGWKGVSNVCDFIVFHNETLFYIECKAVHGNTFNYSLLRENQYKGLLEKSKFKHVCAGVVIWFVDNELTVYLPIKFIENEKLNNVKSFNSTKEVPRVCTIIEGEKKRVFFKYNLTKAFIDIGHRSFAYGY